MERLLKILVAEDIAGMRMLLSGVLQKWGYEVIAVEDGTTAWNELAKGEIRLVLCDWEMPGLDGPAICERVRKRTDSAYVYLVLLTHHADSESLARGLAAGADDYLRKPFDPIELRARLEVGKRLLRLHDELVAKNEELDRANEHLRHLADTDALTRLANRRILDNTAASLHAAALSAGSAYGMLVLDIDHFKSVNDRFGHAVGDAVLSATADALRAATRESDLVFRYGGEEYAVIVAGATVCAVERLAERLRAAVARTTTNAGAEVVRVTASVGAAVYDGREDVAWTEVLRRADAALYAAKHAGRDRFVVHVRSE